MIGAQLFTAFIVAATVLDRLDDPGKTVSINLAK